MTKPKILLTSGPTRQYLDPIRYLTNASSGRTGAALAQAAIRLGFDVVIVSGPVDIEYPEMAQVVPVISTEEMLEKALELLPECVGVIGVAAPCDYRPMQIAPNKLSKSDLHISGNKDEGLLLQLVETPDIIASLASQCKKNRGSNQAFPWLVAFALETQDHRVRALQKLQRKSCDLIILNDQTAINGPNTKVEIIDRKGKTLAFCSGSKMEVAEQIMKLIKEQFTDLQP